MANGKRLATLNSVQTLLEASRGAIASRLPKHITPDRIIKVALTAVNRTPALLTCTRESLMLAVVQAAELGLEPGGALGEGYLVPYGNQAQFIPGYRGLISLARRSGQIVSVEAHPVYEGDCFTCSFGLNPTLEHTPNWDATETGRLKLLYAVARLKDGGVQYEVLTRAQIEAVRSRSKASKSGPWVTGYDEMARKTAIRRLFKYLPVSVEMARALELQAGAESGEFVGATLDGDTLEIAPEPSDQPGIRLLPRGGSSTRCTRPERAVWSPGAWAT